LQSPPNCLYDFFYHKKILGKQQDMNNINEKLETVNKLPEKPYCSFSKSRSFIYPKEIALNLPYIQYNTPISKPFMLFDIDNNKEPFEWLDNTKKPIPPNWIVINKKNGHKLYIYELKEPVYFGKNARIKPQIFYKNVYDRLAEQFDADLAFNNTFSKNVFYKTNKWEIENSCIMPYSLHELLEATFSEKSAKAENSVNYGKKQGRNVELFNRCRFYAYRIFRLLTYNVEALHATLSLYIQEQNRRFKYPLHWKELKHIVKSIVKWVAKHFSPEKFTARQKYCNAKSRESANAKALIKYKQCLDLFNKRNMSIKAIAKQTGFAITSIYRWFKLFKVAPP